ncbi:hypothetical protein AJ80_03126 [Polytolypa hystricis UAMH7299]|uniref:Myb-like domain-containing protein n=1 Tax=Polytolypa hystricis (strain UAMH7299) TaxID=1447883 RepID=A0A2B7YJ23_POLH7|nr:hypothetical protein AJ80_03126 [Polytolypa hystricis UAMH7299]
MGFGREKNPDDNLVLITLKVLTTMTWKEIIQAFIRLRAPPGKLDSGDCRSRWSRHLSNDSTTLALEAQQPLDSGTDLLVRHYLQMEGMNHINALGRAFLNRPAPANIQTTQTATATTSAGYPVQQVIPQPTTASIAPNVQHMGQSNGPAIAAQTTATGAWFPAQQIFSHPTPASIALTSVQHIGASSGPATVAQPAAHASLVVTSSHLPTHDQAMEEPFFVPQDEGSTTLPSEWQNIVDDLDVGDLFDDVPGTDDLTLAELLNQYNPPMP